jgi:pimeloyl-ACP methyl ester carboxylesterase
VRHRAPLIVALVVALAATACTKHPTTEPAPNASASPITWTDCTSQARAHNSSVPTNIKFDCGDVRVPKDWHHPDNGETLKIALMRARALDPGQRQGSVVMNPGGPGGSGIDYLPDLVGNVTNLLQHFDVIGFDPRGVGASDNVKCISDSDLDKNFGYDPDPVSQASWDTYVTLQRHIADGCQTKFGEELSLYATVQAAQDMDVIRSAVGDAKLTYLGFSYGTLLGAVYAQLHPENVRAMVLDGAVDPTATSTEAAEGQAKGFQQALTNFTTWCAGNAHQCDIAADPQGQLAKALATAQTNPVKARDGRTVTQGLVFWGIVEALYSEQIWSYLGSAIHDLNGGDPTAILRLSDFYTERDPSGRYSTLFDANNAVNCADANYPTVDEARALQSQWRAKYPLFGAPMAAGITTCAVWPAKKDPFPTGPAKGAPPILVVGTTGDPATPYEGTQKLADMLGVGQVLTWEGSQHTAYPDTTCIRNAVDNYLINLTLPAKGLRCPASS